MGDKINARNIAKETNIPIIRGSDIAIGSVNELIEISNQIGYPVLLKAAAGGGGKGMRIVESASDLEQSFSIVKSVDSANSPTFGLDPFLNFGLI